MVPCRAAFNEKGVPEEPAGYPRTGGSMRETEPPVRLRDDRPERLRVGDRPAGAESGEARPIPVLSCLTTGLGVIKVRGRVGATGELETGKPLVLGVLDKKNV